MDWIIFVLNMNVLNNSDKPRVFPFYPMGITNLITAFRASVESWCQYCVSDIFSDQSFCQFTRAFRDIAVDIEF